MRKLIRIIGVALLLLMSVAPTFAQSGRLYYHDDEGRLDRGQVESAAQPLLSRGAYVAIYAVDSGKGTEFLNQLQDDGLRNGDTVNPNLVAIFVSFNDRYSEIRYGDKWVNALNSRAGQIQQNTLNSNLAAGNSTKAFADTLTQLNSAIGSPSAPGGNVGTGSAGFDTGLIPWCLGILALAGIVPIGWRFLSQRRSAGQVLDTARGAMQDARMKAGAAIADTAQVLKSVKEKAQYDKLSYPADDVAHLSEWQSSAEQLFVEAQTQFDAADEQVSRLKEPDETAFKAAGEAYTKIADSVAKAGQLLQQTEARRAELDKIGAQAPAKVDDAKKALADAAQRLDVLGDSIQRDSVLAPVQEQVNHAEALLDEHQAAAAIPVAEAASAAANELTQVLERFGALQEGLSSGRAAAERATTQGFRIEGGLAAFDRAEQELTRAARALEQHGVAAALPILQSAEAAQTEGKARGGDLPEIFERNKQRIPELQNELKQVETYIGEGRKTFDLVDEFAPTTWSDIRGNGSEAEAAHADAAALIEQAIASNTMERQEIYEAGQDLDQAAARLGFARQLIDAIVQRLRDLEAARNAARAEVADAQRDIETGQTYVQQHDPDIGQAPPQSLQRAAAMLQQANAELAREQPDWLLVVKLAQEANKLADEALAGARSEVERIAKLRETLKRAQPVAMGEVQKIAEFVKIHSDDIPPPSRTRLNALANDVRLAENAAAQAEQREDEARAAQLRDAVDQYTALQRKAEQLYTEIYQEFQHVDQLRTQLQSHVSEAQNAMMRANSLRTQLGAVGSSQGDALLAQAQTTLNAIGPVRTDQELQAAIQASDRARAYAQQAEQAYTNDINTIRRNQTSGTDILTGMVIGQVLGGGRRHGGGWGGGGSWGGGGGSGGGSWGGGGSSGGSGW